MMPLAASGIELAVAVVVAVIYGIFKLVENVTSGDPKPPPMPAQPERGQGSIRESQEQEGHDSDEERTRKFLEALGLPAGTLQPRAGQETMRSGDAPMRRRGSAPPVPPFVPQTMRGGRGSIPHGAPDVVEPTRTQLEQAQRDRQRRQAQPPPRRGVPPPMPEPESRPYDGAIGRFHFPQLETPETPEFHTRTSDVSAIPFELADSVAGKLYLQQGTARQEELLALARSPKALRQAILLREILGPPRSLQNDFAAPNLAPL